MTLLPEKKHEKNNKNISDFSSNYIYQNKFIFFAIFAHKVRKT